MRAVVPIEKLESRRLLAGLTAQYFDRVDFADLKMTRVDATVDFTWPAAPDPAVGADFFSVRWRGQIEPQFSQNYTFYVSSDDGARLWVDGRLIIDNWVNQLPTEKSGIVALEANQRYDIRFDYYDSNLGAQARLSWSSPSQAKQIIPSGRLFPRPNGLDATYFDNADFTGTTFERADATVDFNWSGGSPDVSIGSDTFSARWTGQIQPQFDQTYTFTVTGDAGSTWKLRVDDQLIVDNTSLQDGGDIMLEAGKLYDIKLEYTEQTGPASIKLEWASPSQAKQVIPTSRLFASASTAIPSRRPNYTNSVFNADRPDPGVIFADGAYWMLHTTGGPNEGWPLYRSTDMTSWTFVTHLLTGANKPAFMTDAFWAPDLQKVGDHYVLTGTSWSAQYGRLVLALATANEIAGPYTVQVNPIVVDSVSVLDSHLFIDHDGKVYLSWKRDSNGGTGTFGSIRIREMNAAGTAFAVGSVETVILDNNFGGWEQNLAEAPWTVRRGQYYYLFYSGAFIDTTYKVGVARATSPLGPFTRNPANPIIANNAKWAGPGHGGFALDRDGTMWHLYHARYQSDPNFGRVQMLDRVVWGADDWPSFAGGSPSITQQAGLRVNAASGAGRITFTGSATLADNWLLKRNAADSTLLDIFTNAVLTQSIAYDELEQLTFDGRGGNDTLVLDHSRGDAVPGAGISFLGNAGTDTIQIIGASESDVFRHTTGQIVHGSGILTYSAETLAVEDGTFHFNNDAAGLNLNVTDANVIFNTTNRLGALTLNAGGEATLLAGGSRVLRTSSLTIASTGRLDLSDNDLILDYTAASPIGSWGGSAYTGITGYIADGLLMTSSASEVPIRNLGVADATDALGLIGTQTTTWSGQNVDATSILVKYTYVGDANVDGTIDADDYANINFYAGVPNAHGWYNGDFNLDGRIDADDFALIDFNVHAQGLPL